MRGLFFPGNREVVIEEYPDPRPGRGRVVLRMKAAGICGSDLHWGYRRSREEASDLVEKRGKIIPGHEPAGVVEEVGEGVEDLEVGDRVMAYHAAGCGHCPDCLDGYQMYCKKAWVLGSNVHGGFADLMLARAIGCLKLPDELSLEDGAIGACAGGTAYQILRDLEITARDDAAFYGLGPLGLAAVLVAKAMGARVIGIDIVEERLSLAKKLGADEVVNAAQEDPVKRVKALTGGRGADLAADFSGSHQAQTNAVDCLGRGGRVGFIGAQPDPVESLTISIAQVRRNRLRLAGNWIFKTNTAVEMLDFMARRHVHLDRMVTHRFPLEKAQEAFKLFDAGRTGKVIFTW